jgi:hypothetical protein
VGGQVDLHASEVSGGERPAVAALRLQVAQAVLLDDAVLTATGPEPAVDLRSARIAGDLEMRRTRVSHPHGTGLRLNTATVDGRVTISETDFGRSILDLRDSTVGALYDDPARVTGEVQVAGLVYRGMPGHPGVTVAERLAWLGRMPGYAAQPYRQLAAAYQGAGHEEEARRVLVAQQEHLHRSGTLTGWARARHRLFGLSLQYGYQPARAVALLLAVLAIAVGLFLGLGGGTRTAAGGGPGRAGRRRGDPAGDDRGRGPLPAGDGHGVRAGAGGGRLGAHPSRLGHGDAGRRRLLRLGTAALRRAASAIRTGSGPAQDPLRTSRA